MELNLIIEIVKALGGIAATMSVIWAIYIYKKSENQKVFSNTRENLSQLKSQISSHPSCFAARANLRNVRFYLN